MGTRGFYKGMRKQGEKGLQHQKKQRVVIATVSTAEL